MYIYKSYIISYIDISYLCIVQAVPIPSGIAAALIGLLFLRMPLLRLSRCNDACRPTFDSPEDVTCIYVLPISPTNFVWLVSSRKKSLGVYFLESVSP